MATDPSEAKLLAGHLLAAAGSARSGETIAVCLTVGQARRLVDILVNAGLGPAMGIEPDGGR